MKDIIKRILKEETEYKDLKVPYRLEDRPERYKRILYKKIQEYIKNGSKGSLNLHNAPIDGLPSNLKTVGSALYLEGTKILELPPNLTIGGSLNLNYTPIHRIPEGLRVGGDLWLINTPLGQKYSEDEIEYKIVELGGYVKRSIINKRK